MSTTGGYIGAITPSVYSSKNDLETVNGIVVYPNPCNDQVRIESQDIKNLEICISNLDGKELLYIKGLNSCDVSNLKKGMYIIKVTRGNVIYSQKLIKQ